MRRRIPRIQLLLLSIVVLLMVFSFLVPVATPSGARARVSEPVAPGLDAPPRIARWYDLGTGR